ncbi:hypothetical protein PMIN04_006030 [Paraphaeosphaeria minitans]
MRYRPRAMRNGCIRLPQLQILEDASEALERALRVYIPLYPCRFECIRCKVIRRKGIYLHLANCHTALTKVPDDCRWLLNTSCCISYTYVNDRQWVSSYTLAVPASPLFGIGFFFYKGIIHARASNSSTFSPKFT